MIEEYDELAIRSLIVYAVNGFMQNSNYQFLMSFLGMRGVAIDDIIYFFYNYIEKDSKISVDLPVESLISILEELIIENIIIKTDQNTVISALPPLEVPENKLFTETAKDHFLEIKNRQPRIRKKSSRIEDS
ncbi:MAG: hypothetical protein EF806_06605 [Candidatus Methanoliparum thermophilum]|uniref:Uncharacterized protein n=1 Tax=Methanoliparum thermophilum TaxID=2491083 RepID=A0A520KRB1_METT2|nr:hypothetical protein [Candidatus Methanoliparum sp. LAM-1]RZN63894.1 MAG: hypothetical protein EF806_06605 [Candidatus Methanoliparum thermophilum]BDC36375.1 hypothetical protein MTLP_10570 [Candidatus Methanoliparum sp. LAM-1]